MAEYGSSCSAFGDPHPTPLPPPPYPTPLPPPLPPSTLPPTPLLHRPPTPPPYTSPLPPVLLPPHYPPPSPTPSRLSCAALNAFVGVEGIGLLPTVGTVPDMTADTQSYVELQSIYQQQANADLAAVQVPAIRPP